MTKSIATQLAEDFAEQKASSTTVEGVDKQLMTALWKANALEVLAFALPRLVPEEVPVAPAGERVT